MYLHKLTHRELECIVVGSSFQLQLHLRKVVITWSEWSEVVCWWSLDFMHVQLRYTFYV